MEFHSSFVEVVVRIYMHSGTQDGAAFYLDTADGAVHVVSEAQPATEWFSVAQAVKVLAAAVRIKEPEVRSSAIRAVGGYVEKQLGEHIREGGIFVVG
ncbi:MAG TPA: hypothetical protein VMA86_11890 [Acetobacteraceae bacterium]|nr:hypothetical protein [Acetobacteraceae bacterium]